MWSSSDYLLIPEGVCVRRRWVQWEFMDAMVTVESDAFCDFTKLARAGFDGQVRNCYYHKPDTT